MRTVGYRIKNKKLRSQSKIQLQRLECSVASLLPARQKAPLRQELHPPHILNEPLPLFIKKRGETP
ncbi:hypothetical protein ADK18_25250 [Bacillus anthracis]|nr:hypothetical protein ADK17_26460 [Bacillus anthracis]KOS25142.1 hypothetical protein ADK18_25250 [Bacillus anthracis]